MSVAPPLCDHHVPSVSRMSRSAKNPGRHYFTCRTRYGAPNKCDFFCWVDEHTAAVQSGKEPEPPRDPPPPQLPTPVEPRMSRELFLVRYINNVTPDDIARIQRAEQRSPEWLAARTYRLTASNFGSAAGHNKNCSPHGLIRDMLWKNFKGNEMTAYGTENEEIAFDSYQVHGVMGQLAEIGAGQRTVLGFATKEVGLHIHHQHFWLGVSPDGLVDVVPPHGGPEAQHLIEIKCPWKCKDRPLHSGQDFYPLEDLPGGLRLPIPHYYFDQMQGIMGALGLPFADFVVWTAKEMQITRLPFLPAYWEHELFPALQHFYFEMFVPAVVRFLNGELLPGNVE
jgi:hypothetical protein